MTQTLKSSFPSGAPPRKMFPATDLFVLHGDLRRAESVLNHPWTPPASLTLDRALLRLELALAAMRRAA